MYIKGARWSSWHLLRTWTRVPGRAITVCGRQVTNPLEHEGLPAEKTCEICLRVDAAHREKAARDQS